MIRVPILKESNVGSRMAIDEKKIDGVCYTIISNRETSKIALMADTLRTSELRQVLSRLAVKTKMQVNSVRIRHRQAVLALEWKKNKTVQEQLTLQEKFAN